MIGETFGRYTVIALGQPRRGMSTALCKWSCGTERVVYTKNLRSGNSRSCGCLHREKTAVRNFKHGKAKTPTWHIWVGMHQRCSAETGKNYRWYKARGIRVCDRWREFLNFLADMGERPLGAQIDRIDNDGDYTPENCRWISASTNSRNRSNNTVLTHRGESLPLVVWAERLGWPRHVISNRLRYGWDIDRALSQPPLNPAVGVNAGIKGGAANG